MSTSSPLAARNRLVYLLDHEYTPRGLDRSRLKGPDAPRVTLLEAAAKRADCDVVLALADVHETWTVYESDERNSWYGRSRYSRLADWDDDDDDVDSLDGDETGEYDLEDLIESEVKLDSWIDPRNGRLEKVGLSIGTDEVCASTPSGDLEPYNSEYEGYMGSALVGSYGEPWAAELMAAWAAKRRFYHPEGAGPEAWMASLPSLCLALRESGDAGTAAARLLLRESWSWLSDAIEGGLELPTPSRREQTQSALGRPVGAMLEGASLVDATDLRDAAVGILCRDGDLLACAIAALRATPPSRWSAAGLDVVATHCSAVLEARLARPARAGDDWSIELPSGCTCELCGELRAFIGDPTQTTLEWPLAKERRRYVHGRIDTAELPVRHQTRRVGRPYTLVLTKTDALFERETQQRRRNEEDLAWLERRRADRASRRTGSR